MPRVVHFDLSADEPERAIEFYRKVLGWRIEKWEGPFDYWFIKTGEPGEPGIDGGLAKRINPTDTTVNVIDVPSVDEFADKVETNGGKILEPKRSIPGVGYLVTCQDTEGNTFGLMQMDEYAK
jgi:predicted enzyme related to lactoylglutathione lyase